MSKRQKNRFGRRSLIRGLGAAAVAYPFLPLLSAEGDASGPKRLILFFTPHGTVHDRWGADGSERDFTLRPILSPLEPYKDRLIVLDQMNVDASISVGAPHTKGPALLWTAAPLIEDMRFSRTEPVAGTTYFGWNSGPSVDQVLADTLSTGLRYRSLEVGARTGIYAFPGSRMIYRAAEQPLTPYDNPLSAFEEIYGAGQSESELDRIRGERRSVLDVLGAELDQIRGAVPQNDRIKIDRHLEAVRDMERSLEPGPVCMPPALGPTPTNPFMSSAMPTVLQQNMQILTRAMECDLTRVGSVQVAVGENDGTVYDWTGVDREIHHLITHESDEPGQSDLSDIYTWYATQFAQLLGMLDAVPEGDCTMLDNTLVVWGSELGVGYNHSFDDVPFVVAGGGNMGVDTGRFLQLGGMEHNRLLVSILHALGRTDLNQFGPMDTGSGPIPGFFA